ncbi:MAG: Hsp20 family protein, partial [Candidatus Bathyarchaeia archaeon]
AELPGVEKDDIELHATERGLTISVDTESRKYYKELKLPAEVEPSSAKSSYRNGVLEVTLTKKALGRGLKGFRIRVE